MCDILIWQTRVMAIASLYTDCIQLSGKHIEQVLQEMLQEVP